ncbi:MAG TPA: hypothetical protein VES21_11545, partial [Nocardioidaceae bacterium]|nr:hypothetical protein [Nocardioidaceae bacterium]
MHPQLGEALRAGEVSGFVVSMVAAATARVESGARRLLEAAVTADAVEVPAGAAISAARARAAEADPDADAAAARAAAARRVYLKPLDD